LRTYQRWVEGDGIRADGRPQAKRARPSNKLSEREQQVVLSTCMQPRFADMPPTQIVPILADEGTYLASESTFYRLLRAHGAQHARGRAARRSRKAAPTHVARAGCLTFGSQITAKLRGRPMAHAIALEVVTPSPSLGTTRRVIAKHLATLFWQAGSARKAACLRSA
jgi:hypothetical protein